MSEDLTTETVTALYAEPPDTFIEHRTALITRLKERGAADAAKEGAKLRRPTVAAWTIDRVAREHPDAIAALIALGDGLGTAQAASDADQIRTLGEERRRLITRPVREAEAARASAW